MYATQKSIIKFLIGILFLMEFNLFPFLFPIINVPNIKQRRSENCRRFFLIINVWFHKISTILTSNFIFAFQVS